MITAKNIVHMASWKKWICCKGNCKQVATHIHARLKGRELTISGRCEKHKDEGDFTLEELRELSKPKV